MCWGVFAWCGWVGVVEGDCCFLVVKRFLEGCGEFEFVVELVDGDEGGEADELEYGGLIEHDYN